MLSRERKEPQQDKNYKTNTSKRSQQVAKAILWPKDKKLNNKNNSIQDSNKQNKKKAHQEERKAKAGN